MMVKKTLNIYKSLFFLKQNAQILIAQKIKKQFIIICFKSNVKHFINLYIVTSKYLSYIFLGFSLFGKTKYSKSHYS